MSEDPNAAERFDIAKTIMLVGFSTAVALAVMVIVCWLAVLLKGWPMPESLDKMAYAAFTFVTTLAGFGKQFVDKIAGGP